MMFVGHLKRTNLSSTALVYHPQHPHLLSKAISAARLENFESCVNK